MVARAVSFDSSVVGAGPNRSTTNYKEQTWCEVIGIKELENILKTIYKAREMPAKMCENISPVDLGQSVERRPFTVIVEGNIGSGKFETDTYLHT